MAPPVKAAVDGRVELTALTSHPGQLIGNQTNLNIKCSNYFRPTVSPFATTFLSSPVRRYLGGLPIYYLIMNTEFKFLAEYLLTSI